MKVEFFNGSDGKVWYRSEDRCAAFTQSDTEIVDFIVDTLMNVFPLSYKRLDEMFASSKRNKVFFKYRIAERFIRCNMGDDDCKQMDINNGQFNLERVSCPLRGQCKDEGIICCPKASYLMTQGEQKVAKLFSEGYTIGETADILGKKLSTVNNQLCHLQKRMGLTRRQVIAVCRNLDMA